MSSRSSGVTNVRLTLSTMARVRPSQLCSTSLMASPLAISGGSLDIICLSSLAPPRISSDSPTKSSKKCCERGIRLNAIGAASYQIRVTCPLHLMSLDREWMNLPEDTAYFGEPRKCCKCKCLQDPGLWHTAWTYRPAERFHGRRRRQHDHQSGFGSSCRSVDFRRGDVCRWPAGGPG